MKSSRYRALLKYTLVILLFTALTIYTGQAVAWAAPGGDIEGKAYNNTQLNYDVSGGGFNVFSAIVQILVSLVVIGGLAYLTAKFMKNNLNWRSQGEWIKIYEQQSLGMNKGLFITEVAGKVYVLGVTEETISVISEITDAELIEDMNLSFRERQELQAVNPWFNQLLAKLNINPGKTQSVSGKKEQRGFNSHIQSQIKKLQELSEKPGRKEIQGDEEKDE